MMMPKMNGQAVLVQLEIKVRQNEMADALRKGEEVRLIGFGVLRAVDVPAREGRDPRTHAAIQIKAHKKIKFTPSHLIL